METPPTSTTSPEITASLFRRRAASTPLWLEVSGSSMGKTLQSGSRVLIVPSPRPRWGEIWAFYDRNGRLVVHRSRGPRGSEWLFQGDAVEVADPPVPDTMLIGRVATVQVGERALTVGARRRWTGGVLLIGRHALR